MGAVLAEGGERGVLGEAAVGAGADGVVCDAAGRGVGGGASWRGCSDEILARIDWSPWEAGYDLTRGQPPIHPRVLASVILYGLLTRIRSSRALEEALSVRLDFRWLAEGRSIDHTTLSTFRKQHPEALKNLFVQIGLVAREF